MSLESDALLGTTGLIPKEITHRHMAASASLPSTFARRLRSWVNASEQDAFKYRPPPKDMERLFTQLTRPLMEAEVAAWVEAVGVDNPAMVAEYFLALTRARKYISDIWPSFHIQGAAGPQLLPLSHDDAHEVASIWFVLEDPESLLDDADSWTLTPTQALAFRTCYPDLYSFALDTIQAVFTEKRAKDPDWALRHEAESVWKTLQGLPPDAMPSPPPPPPPPAESELEIDPEKEKTQADVSSQAKGGRK